MENKVKNLIEEPLHAIGIEVYKVEKVVENDETFLRILLDSKDGIDLETCVKATRIINPIIDKADLIEESYILDVASRGEE